METTQSRNILITAVIAVLVCLLAVLAFFTWHLSGEVRDMRNVISQTNNTAPLTAAINPAPLLTNPPSTAAPSQAIPINPDPQTQIPAPGNNDPFTMPFPDPFGKSWPGFTDPNGQIAEMQQRMDELMNSMTQGFPFFNQQDFGFGFIDSGPNISMTEDSYAYHVIIAVPEGQQVELNTELNNNILVVSGSVKSEREENNSGLSSRSMQESRFSQSINLPGDIDEEGMTVEQQDNQIVVTVPKV